MAGAAVSGLFGAGFHGLGKLGWIEKALKSNVSLGRLLGKSCPATAPVAAEAEQGGLNLYKWRAPQTSKASGWRNGDRMLHLPDQGTPKLNWKQNAGRLRSEMGQGKPIFDSYVDPATGQQIPTGGFLRSERFLHASRGWEFNPQTGAYHPPAT